MRNTFGTLFAVTTFGESHGAGVGAVVDGCPPHVRLVDKDIQIQLDRRRPGQSDLATARYENDRVEILSGIEKGVTLGTPIALLVRNQDTKPDDYKAMQAAPRPSHADFTYQTKYGISASSGGGRASARETVGRVAAGAVAEQFLIQRHGVDVVAWVSAIADISVTLPEDGSLSRAQVDRHPVRCPDLSAAVEMAQLIRKARDDGDSLGGVITGVCRGVPAGWGEPVFDKLSARLGAAMLSIPAVKGFEIGSGFAGTRLRGSTHNDRFIHQGGRLRTATNRSGGIQGGISNGEPVVFRVAFKPTATISRAQATSDYEGNEILLEVRGRHDPCVLPRAVPVVESMAALVLADLALWAAGAGVS
jgi:chorismate synthase